MAWYSHIIQHVQSISVCCYYYWLLWVFVSLD